MIYKVFYQEDLQEAPRRENTRSLYAEADSIPELKKKLTAKYDYNIEHVTELTGAYLEFEEQEPGFKVIKDL